MTGFAAASYQRGVDFIQVPTTVGGKTAVNHALGKNMIGAFHQPVAVIADMDTLSTLNDRELKAGLAEVIKYGFIIDADFFVWLETNIDALLARDVAATGEAVRRSCEIKARVVEADEQEHGIRALLNLGHTFGHAIEGALGYGVWLHGEAVSAGIAMALDFSNRLGLKDISPERFLAYMSRDKKVSAGQLRFIVLDAIGQSHVTADFEEATLHATLEHFSAG